MGKGKNGNDNATGMRHLQAFMASVAFVIVYIIRVNMSVAIIAMTNNKNANPNFPEYKWNEAEKGEVLSSFFWGYSLLQVIIGKLAEKHGSKLILAVCMTAASIFNILIPFAAPYGYMPVVVLRMLEGAAQGAFMPCTTVLLSQWFSPIERSRAAAIVISGSKLSAVITLPMSAFLSASSYGWPSVFYVTGGFGLVWVLVWLWFGASAPDSCRNISQREKLYIETSVKNSNQNEQKSNTPWKRMFLSKPLWAIIISHAGHSWGYWLLLTQLPNYMNSVMGLNIKKNGLLSALPYLSAWSATILYSWVAVYLNEKYSISKTIIRKIFNTIGLWGLGLAFVALATWNTDNVAVVVGILIAGVTMNAAIYLGFMTNHMDLSPNYCGTLMGITNSLSNIASIYAPLTVGWLVKDPTLHSEWKTVFYVSGGVMFLSNLIYLVFGTSKVQPWNSPRTPIVKNYGIQDKKSVETKEHGRQLL